MGCVQLNKAVQRVKPKLHVFGHIHGGRGREEGPNGTLFVNCAALLGKQLRPPIFIEIGRGAADYESAALTIPLRPRPECGGQRIPMRGST